jgi:hypothetical protein
MKAAAGRAAWRTWMVPMPERRRATAGDPDGQRSDVPPHGAAKACPSAPCEEGALVLGVMTSSGRLAYVQPPTRVDAAFVARARSIGHPERTFRFFSPSRDGTPAPSARSSSPTRGALTPIGQRSDQTSIWARTGRAGVQLAGRVTPKQGNRRHDRLSLGPRGRFRLISSGSGADLVGWRPPSGLLVRRPYTPR